MRCVTLAEVGEELERNPEDWSLRLRLIEGYILEADFAEAKRLVRDSPDDVPLPRELQFRLHTVMTGGAAAVERLYAESPELASPFVRDSPPGSEPEKHIEPLPSPPKKSEAGRDDTAPAEESTTAVSTGERLPEQPSKHSKVVPAKPERKETGKPERNENEKENGKATRSASDRGASRGGVPLVRPEAKAWSAPSGFVFGDEEALTLAGEKLAAAAGDRRPQAGLKISAFTLALIVHIVVIVLFAFVVVGLPRPVPLKIIAVNVEAERDPIIAPPLIERDIPKAASASSQPAALITTSSMSVFSVPEFDREAKPDVTLLLAGTEVGHGMSFQGEGEESNVNFFGIRSGGKRIAFIVDATRFMLVDEKGGMFAYDKVKEEVAAMLSLLKRATAFNIILYDGKTLSLFREEPVAAKPSAVRMATEWLHSLNRDYESLGLGGRVAIGGGVSEDIGIVEARDNLGYAKAIQLALEMDVNSVFAISSGYRRISRSLTPEQVAEARKMTQGMTPGTVDPQDRKRWNDAVEKTTEWLRKENSARAEKQLPPKVVINFNNLVQQVTGQSPPRATGGGPAPAGLPRPGAPYTQEEIEDHIKEVVGHFYKETNKTVPEIHMVLFLGEDEEIGDDKDHFRRLTKQNKGKLKILEGLAGLADVTGK